MDGQSLDSTGIGSQSVKWSGSDGIQNPFGAPASFGSMGYIDWHSCTCPECAQYIFNNTQAGFGPSFEPATEATFADPRQCSCADHRDDIGYMYPSLRSGPQVRETFEADRKGLSGHVGDMVNSWRVIAPSARPTAEPSTSFAEPLHPPEDGNNPKQLMMPTSVTAMTGEAHSIRTPRKSGKTRRSRARGTICPTGSEEYRNSYGDEQSLSIGPLVHVASRSVYLKELSSGRVSVLSDPPTPTTGIILHRIHAQQRNPAVTEEIVSSIDARIKKADVSWLKGRHGKNAKKRLHSLSSHVAHALYHVCEDSLQPPELVEGTEMLIKTAPGSLLAKLGLTGSDQPVQEEGSSSEVQSPPEP